MDGNKKKAVFFAVMAGSMWGTIGVFVNILGSYGIRSTGLTVWRLLIAAVITGTVLLTGKRELLRIQIRDIAGFFACGVGSLLLFSLCYGITVEQSSMSAAAVMLYTSPVFVMLISTVVWKEAVTVTKIAAVGMAITGCAFVSGIMSGILSFPVSAYLWGFAAAVGYAMYSITGGALLKRYHAATVLFYSFAMASAAGIFMVDMRSVIVCVAEYPQAGILLIAAAFICNLLPFLCYNTALRYMEASYVAVVASVEPAVASVIGVVVFREPMDWYGRAGVACILGAIVVLNLPKRGKKS